MKKVLIVLGGGGHTEQMLRLVKLLKNKFKYEYVIGKEDKLSSKKIPIAGKISKITEPRKKGGRFIPSLLRTILSFLESFFIISKSKCNYIICSGPGMCAPICIFGKIFRKKIIFLECWSRVSTKSQTGKMLYPLADLFFVHWPELKELYPKAIYAGRLG